MASITKRQNGRWELHYQDADDKRQTIRFGKIPERTAQAWKLKIEDLIAASFGGAIRDETAKWLKKIPLQLEKSLHRKGLIESKRLLEAEADRAKDEAEEARILLKPYLADYIASRTDLKPRTIVKFNATVDYLIEHFGADTPIEEITEGDAEDFRIFLLGKGQAENTIRKHTQITKQFFYKAVKKRLLEVNPFRDLKATVQANPERFYFVDEAKSKKILQSLPSLRWKLIFALCRWGGLRCPSEVAALRLSDIDWEKNRIRIRSEKTEHHVGKGSREIPLFPELKPLLESRWDEAEEGAVFVVDDLETGEKNLRTRLAAYVKAIGFDPWPKLFQNLRSTRETELAQAEEGLEPPTRGL